MITSAGNVMHYLRSYAHYSYMVSDSFLSVFCVLSISNVNTFCRFFEVFVQFSMDRLVKNDKSLQTPHVYTQIISRM